MKEIRAYVQPHVIGRLTQILLEIPGFPGMSVSDCEGFGRDESAAALGFNPFTSKKRIEIFVADERVEPIVAAIMHHAHSGLPGDGKVYVLEVVEGGRIRTGERGKDTV